jgi:hypothetical protein
MFTKLFKYYLFMSFFLVLITFSSTGIAWAYGDISIMVMYGRYFFIAGIVTAFILSALSKRHPIISSIIGMFLGIFLATLPLLVRAGLKLYWDFLALFLTIGLPIYSVPATLIGIAIGFLVKRLRKRNGPTIVA